MSYRVIRETTVTVESPGNLSPEVDFDVGINSCGNVTDGIGIVVQPGGYTPYRCPFIISFHDLERVYTLAKLFRERRADV